jgi:hypothetical protein
LDHLSSANDSMAAGNGIVLHAGRLYTHSVDTGDRHRIDPYHSGTKSSLGTGK